MIGKEYITFGDMSRCMVVSRGSIRVNESFVLKDVALVSNLHFNLLSVSQFMRITMKCTLKGLVSGFGCPGGSCL
jgi:hypothetical protein